MVEVNSMLVVRSLGKGMWDIAIKGLHTDLFLGSIKSQRSSKKDDGDSATAKYSSAYMVSMAVDFLFIVVPILLIHTMDLGVGSFVVANALVSRHARNVFSGGWKTALQSTCPLILLGFARLVSTSGVDYQ
uniref:Uncharacterized protein n=1 Tax=Chenopodium quinoa TaxID=63459 RepID=A0A803L614_CHEQI